MEEVVGGEGEGTESREEGASISHATRQAGTGTMLEVTRLF